MKSLNKLKIVLILSCYSTISICQNINRGNAQFVGYGFLGGYETTSNFSGSTLKIGVVRNLGQFIIRDPSCWFCFTDVYLSDNYQQMFFRYNFIKKSIGLQGALGHIYGEGGLGIVARYGINIDYSLSKEKLELAQFFSTGLDYGGRHQILIGANLNVTRNLDKQLLGFLFSASIGFAKTEKRL